MTGIEASCVFSEKVLDVAGSNMEIQKAGYIKYIDFGKQKVNNRALDQKIILQGLRYFLESFFKGWMVLNNEVLTKNLSPTLK